MFVSLRAWWFLAKTSDEERLAELRTQIQLSCLRLAEAVQKFRQEPDSTKEND
jgi:hypothetical protein